jgi:hypothetical protein
LSRSAQGYKQQRPERLQDHGYLMVQFFDHWVGHCFFSSIDTQKFVGVERHLRRISLSVTRCGGKVIMSPLGKVEMSP